MNYFAGIKILFVGSNPSQSSPDNSAFHPNTESRKTLDSWCEGIHAEFLFCNVSDLKTPNNAPIKYLPNLDCQFWKTWTTNQPHLLITLGGTAKNAVKKNGFSPHLELPHPSKRNRLLNDPQVVLDIKKKLQSTYLNATTWRVKDLMHRIIYKNR